MEDWQWDKLKMNCERAQQIPLKPLEVEPRPANWDKMTDTQKMLDRQMAFIIAVSKRSNAMLDENGDIILEDENE